MSSLLCLGRHTVTGLLTTSGLQFQDWSAAYRLFSKGRLPAPQIFSVVRRAVADQLPAEAPFRAVLDDSLLRRSGLHVPGVAWRRDPLGPRFQTNFVRGQRFLQISAVLPASNGACRLAPIAFQHAPTPSKPSRQAGEDAWTRYREQARIARLGVCASHQIQQLRESLDEDQKSRNRLLLVAFDGGYTNATVLQHLPSRTTCIGRIRKDAKLYFQPDPQQRKLRGRRPQYGAPAPTPEQLRTDQNQPWKTMNLTHSGRKHCLRYKCSQPLLWRTAGVHHLLQLLVIAPLAYRLQKNSRLLYRQPAYLVCTDPTLDPLQVIDAYFQRWEIEVNFRDEKTLLGTGQAQVRTLSSVQSAPALSVAAYALLMVSAQHAFARSKLDLLPRPKWLARSPSPRVSTQRLIHLLRAEVWARGLGLDHFSDFAVQHPTDAKPDKSHFPLASAVFYANA